MSVKSLVASIEDSLEEFVTLEVVTAVGNVQPTLRDAEGNKTKINLDPGAKILRTRFSLLLGDITTEMDPAFVTGEYQGLRQFHADREQQAWGIVKHNVEALRSLIELIDTHGSKDGAEGAAK